MKLPLSWVHPCVTALLVVAVVVLSIRVALMDPTPVPEAAVPPPRSPPKPAAGRPVAPQGGGGTLLHQPPVIVGTGDEERIGFEKPGPVLERAAPQLIVPPAEASVRSLRLTRLYFTKNDSVLTGPRSAMSRPLNLWLPRREGAFCNVTAVPGTNGDIFLPARALPDGVWCLHRGTLADRQPAPEYCATFITGGLASPKVVSAKATLLNGQATLTFNFKNSGTGEFNEGRMVITLQKNVGTYGQFKSRWEAKVDPIPPGATATLVREYSATKWEPGEYYFAGHLNSDCNYNDSESVFDNFKSDLFTVAAP